MKSARLLGTALIATFALSVAACGGSGSSSNKTETVRIVGFAVPEEANKAIAEEFEKTPAGKDVGFTASYGASGDQSRAVAAGLKADYVHFSLEGDVTRLVKEGIVADDWATGPTEGIVSNSVVVFAVQKGNPLGIEDWDDLLKKDVKIITPNPGSSGSARWNIMAAYGHVTAEGGTKADAKRYLKGFFDNVTALPGSGRDATTAFKSGTGNVLITYENEAILARQSGEQFDYIVPPTTLRIDNPGAVTKTASPAAKNWLDFVLGPVGQTQFALKGFRPITEITVPEVDGANDPANPFPQPKKLITITDLGGWSSVNDEFFDEDNGLVVKIQREAGKTK